MYACCMFVPTNVVLNVPNVVSNVDPNVDRSPTGDVVIDIGWLWMIQLATGTAVTPVRIGNEYMR